MKKCKILIIRRNIFLYFVGLCFSKVLFSHKEGSLKTVKGYSRKEKKRAVTPSKILDTLRFSPDSFLFTYCDVRIKIQKNLSKYSIISSKKADERGHSMKIYRTLNTNFVHSEIGILILRSLPLAGQMCERKSSIDNISLLEYHLFKYFSLHFTAGDCS